MFYKLSNYSAHILGIARIFIAYTLVQYGSAKILGFPFNEKFAGVSITSMYGVSGMLELIGGIMLLIGLCTRPVAFVLSGLMAAAYFIGHASNTPLSPMLNGGSLAVVLSFVFLYFSAAGGGKFALDNLLFRNDTAKNAQPTALKNAI